jgi:hypothetical protein
MQLLEAVVEGAALAKTTGLVMEEGLGQVQALVRIVRVEDQATMENLPALVVLVVVRVEDMVVVTGDLVLMGKVAALDLARAAPIRTGTDQVLQMQTLMAMAVAKAMARMVEVLLVEEVDPGTVMPTPSSFTCLCQSKGGAQLSCFTL